VADSNAFHPDFHVALHSNAAPPETAGRARGSRYYFHTNSVSGRRMAEIMAANIKNIYPLPASVQIVPTTGLYELNQTAAPAVIVEIAFHDNLQDATWLHQNIQAIAQNLMQSICKYLGKPGYIPPCMAGTLRANSAIAYSGLQYGTVCTESGNLNLRASPNGAVIGSLPRGAQVIVLSGSTSGFVRVRHNSTEGFVSNAFLCLCNQPVLPFSAQLGTVTTASGNLNLRSAPNTTSAVIASMPRNSTIIVKGSDGAFYSVNFDGVNGFASKSFVTLQ